jgi:hypothetical protein
MGKIFEQFMDNPFWKNIYEKAPSEECKEYYQIMFEYFSFDSDEEDSQGVKAANERLKEIMLSRKDADYIKECTESIVAKQRYDKVIKWLFDGKGADTVSASMFKGEIPNPDYVGEYAIGEGKACFLIKDDSLKTMEGDFWTYLRQEGFRSWGHHGNWGCDWVYVNVNSKVYAPGMPGISITQCIVSKIPKNALSICEFKEIWEILKKHY